MKKILTALSVPVAVIITILSSCTSNEPGPSREVTCLEDLKGRATAVLTSSYQDISYSGMGLDFLHFEAAPDLLPAVKSGIVEYTLTDESSMVCVDMEKEGLKVMFRDTSSKADVCAAFNKKDTALCRRFNTYIDGLRKEDSLDRLWNKWCRRDYDKAQMPPVSTFTGEPLRVGSITSVPFGFIKDGRWSGLEAELMEGFARAEGRPIEFKEMALSGLIPALQTGKIDMIACFLFANEERARQVLFSDSYFTDYSAVFGRTGEAVSTKASFWEKIKNSFTYNILTEDRWKLILDGLYETVLISLLAILLGTAVGSLICWMMMSRRKALRKFAGIYVVIMQGIPILVFLMLLFYVVFGKSNLAARWVAVIAFALNFAAYVCEVFHTAITGVDKGQTEAGLAMGFSKMKTFTNFILPQAVQKALPVFNGECVSLIKGTSVVGYIAILDLTKASDLIRGRTFDAFFPLIIVSVIYFFLTWSFRRCLDLLLKKRQKV